MIRTQSQSLRSRRSLASGPHGGAPVWAALHAIEPLMLSLQPQLEPPGLQRNRPVESLTNRKWSLMLSLQPQLEPPGGPRLKENTCVSYLYECHVVYLYMRCVYI